MERGFFPYCIPHLGPANECVRFRLCLDAHRPPAGRVRRPGFDVNRAETVLPLGRAWVDGRTVDYITTDISDAVMARAEGANYAPRLAGAVGITGKASILERVYMFPGGEQINIFSRRHCLPARPTP